MHKNAVIHKDLIFNIFSKSVHLVYQKPNSTKSLIESAMPTDHFLVEHPVPIHAREGGEGGEKEREGERSKTRKKYQRLIHKTQTFNSVHLPVAC